jgi:hypothetical protein
MCGSDPGWGISVRRRHHVEGVTAGRARMRVSTQVFQTCVLGAFGGLLFVHGVFNVRDGSNVVGGFIYVAAGLFMVVLELGLLAFRIWLLRRASAVNATE